MSAFSGNNSDDMAERQLLTGVKFASVKQVLTAALAKIIASLIFGIHSTIPSINPLHTFCKKQSGSSYQQYKGSDQE